MIIETKFKVGDKVFRVFKEHIQAVISCDVCNDTKQVEIKGTLFKCPNCENGRSNWHNRWFFANSPTTIGQVRVETNLKTLHSSNYFDEEEIQTDTTVTKEQYMLSATGIGSGSIWNHCDLFLSLEEAKAECDKRNNILIEEETKRPV